MYVQELISHEELNSPYSIKQILICTGQPFNGHMIIYFYMIEFEITYGIKCCLVFIPTSSNNEVMEGFLKGCKNNIVRLLLQSDFNGEYNSVLNFYLK